MKAISAIFALCWVVVNAGPIAETPVNYENLVNEILHEIDQIAKEAALTLQHTVEDIVMEPLHKVEEAIESIEARRSESQECVAGVDERVVDIVDTMHKDMATCGVTAAKTSAEIMIDISTATQQLVFDGYDVIRTYRRCRKYNNSVLQNSCYARLTIKATIYLVNARRSIKTIRESTTERIPAVVTDTKDCIHTTAEIAIHDLVNIHGLIDACIAKY